jgi:RNA polymerase sigma factor (sigma-70 family)
MATTNQASIFVVDDDRGVRDSLTLLLGLRGYSIHAFADGESFLSAVDAHSRGCVLLDLRMPGIDGLQVQKELAARDITMPIIIMTAHGDVTAAREALMGGAFDFLEKPVEDAVLRKTLEAALARAQESAAKRAHVESLRSRIAKLTPRERQVLRRVIAGDHNREIATQFGISARTIEVYKARLMDKLQVERLPDLIRLSLDFDPPLDPD